MVLCLSYKCWHKTEGAGGPVSRMMHLIQEVIQLTGPGTALCLTCVTEVEPNPTGASPVAPRWSQYAAREPAG